MPVAGSAQTCRRCSNVQATLECASSAQTCKLRPNVQAPPKRAGPLERCCHISAEGCSWLRLRPSSPSPFSPEYRGEGETDLHSTMPNDELSLLIQRNRSRRTGLLTHAARRVCPNVPALFERVGKARMRKLRSKAQAPLERASSAQTCKLRANVPGLLEHC
jgi:hypothetical protein